MNRTLLRTSPLMLGLSLVACQSGKTEVVADNTPLGSLVTGPERSLDVGDRARFAMHGEANSLVGAAPAETVSIRDGILAVAPETFEVGKAHSHAPAMLETTAIKVDDVSLGAAASASRIVGGTAVIDRGVAAERVGARADGIHQEWLFSDAVPYTGDLVIEVSVSGYRFTGATEGGLHFMGEDGVGLRYSQAVWQGQDGREYPIAPTFEDGRITITIPADVVAETTFPALLDPTISAEVTPDTPVVGPVGALTQQAAIAFDGTNYLVVWADNRNGADSDIWGTRVSATGAVLDTPSIKIAATAGVQTNPTVAYNGSSFLVAWEDYKVTGGTEADIGAAKVTSAGAVTQLGRIAATAANETTPKLAGRGASTGLLVWNADGDIVGARFAGGAFTTPITIAGTTAQEIMPAVAVRPSGNYLVVWSEGVTTTADLRGQIITATGTLSGSAFDISAAAGRQYAPAVAYNGTSFAVVWTNSSSGLDLYGTAVSLTGTVLQTRTEGTAIVGGVAITTAAGNQESPAISCTGGTCLVIWQDRRNQATTGYDLYGQVLTTSFAPSGSELVISNSRGNEFAPDLAKSGSGYYAVWHDNRDGSTNTVFGATISTAGAAGTATNLPSGNNSENAPALGISSTGTFGLFWSDSRALGNDIEYVRFDASGSQLDAASTPASNATAAQLTPAASADLSGNVLAVWSDARGADKDIYAARVNLGTNAVVDPSGIAISTATGDQISPDVASSGSVALVVWQDRRGADFDIYGALVNGATGTVTTDIVISNATSDQSGPSVTWSASASQFIVVWSDKRNGVDPDIYGTRVDATGAVLDSGGVAISTATRGQFGPSIASTSTGALAAWEDRRAGATFNIWGARITGGPSLTVQDANGIQISTGPSNVQQNSAKVASLGTSYAVFWVDNRNGDTNHDIYGQQVSTTGGLTGEFAVTNTADDETSVAAVGGTVANSARVAYVVSRLDTHRVATRLVTTQGATGGMCTSGAQCSTGFCVDGRCCDQACGGNAKDCQACAASKTGGPDGQCLLLSTNTVCRDYESTYCDVREYCTGSSPDCPADLGKNEGRTCDLSTNRPPGTGTGVCPTNAAPGPHACQ